MTLSGRARVRQRARSETALRMAELYRDDAEVSWVRCKSGMLVCKFMLWSRRFAILLCTRYEYAIWNYP